MIQTIRDSPAAESGEATWEMSGEGGSSVTQRLRGLTICVAFLATAAFAGEIDRAVVEREKAGIRGTTYIVDWHGTWDFDHIQPALDAAGDGDTVIVLPSDGAPGGAYQENIQFPPRRITLRSINPEDPQIVADTVIVPAYSGSVLYFDNTPEGAVLDGFTIRNGSAGSGGGILCIGSSPAILRCVVAYNSATYGGAGISCQYGGTPLIWSCTLHNNSGGALGCEGCSPIVVDCLLLDN